MQSNKKSKIDKQIFSLFLQPDNKNKNLKKYIAISGLILLLLTACNSGNNGNLSTDIVNNPKTASGDESDNLPKIEFEKEIHDFGKLIQGEKVSFGFKFKNTGNSDLLISQVNSSCGCTVTRFPKTPIKPEEEKVLKVTFDSNGRKGIQNKTVTVVTNCQPSSNVIRIKAMVIAP